VRVRARPERPIFRARKLAATTSATVDSQPCQEGKNGENAESIAGQTLIARCQARCSRKQNARCRVRRPFDQSKRELAAVDIEFRSRASGTLRDGRLCRHRQCVNPGERKGSETQFRSVFLERSRGRNAVQQHAAEEAARSHASRGCLGTSRSRSSVIS